jgi:hypothetical protein
MLFGEKGQPAMNVEEVLVIRAAQPEIRFEQISGQTAADAGKATCGHRSFWSRMPFAVLVRMPMLCPQGKAGCGARRNNVNVMAGQRFGGARKRSSCELTWKRQSILSGL